MLAISKKILRQRLRMTVLNKIYVILNEVKNLGNIHFMLP
jgi:hypothetical protein